MNNEELVIRQARWALWLWNARRMATGEWLRLSGRVAQRIRYGVV